MKVVTWSGVEEEATSIALMVKKFNTVQKLNSCPGGTTLEQGADSEAEFEGDRFLLIRPREPY